MICSCQGDAINKDVLWVNRGPLLLKGCASCDVGNQAVLVIADVGDWNAAK